VLKPTHECDLGTGLRRGPGETEIPLRDRMGRPVFKLPLGPAETRDFLKVTGIHLKIGLKVPALCCQG
jgi:hypothetical protein